MLRLGKNEYELVRTYSGISVEVFPPGEDPAKRSQKWELVAYYVPRDEAYTLRADGELEFLRIVIQPQEYSVNDWRKLSGLGLDTDETTWFGFVWIENLLVGLSDKESWRVVPGWLEVERVRDYLFHCKFSSVRKLPDDTEEEVEFQDDIPFNAATVFVPINAADPEAAARALAARTVGLKEFAGSKVQRFDPEKKSWLSIRLNTHHRVTLQTPWRQPPAN